MFVLGMLIAFAIVFLVGAVGVAGYAYVAAQLPAPQELKGRAAAFKSVKFFDRNGGLLYESIDPNGGRRTVVALDQISPYLRQATVATEDQNFYRHAGVDPTGIARAIWQDINEGEIVSGASTITQQLARNVFLPPEERSRRTLRRKIKEAVLAAELTRRYDKDVILETYLNEIPYGNVAYGVEAAAETYFDKPAAALNLAESALLAGLPQSPALYDPFVDPEAAKQRQIDVLRLMFEQGYIGAEQKEAAAAASLQYAGMERNIAAPHFVMYVRQQLEQKYGPDLLYRTGLHVYTTLDSKLQAVAEQLVRSHVASLNARHVSNGALLAMRPDTGEILAMVGSADFFDARIDGQVNVTLQARQPGSTVKPITYLAAFQRGWAPSTIIVDEPTSFPDGANPDFRPVNYDDEFHGPVSIRSALANSYNIPAVKTLQYVGVQDMVATARRLGIRSWTRPDYGLSLTLGSGDATLLEMVGVYGVLANEGRLTPPVSVLKVTDSLGRVFEQSGQPAPERVVEPEYAYLITDILSDDEARVPAFGRSNPLAIGRPAAVKTGTTNDYRDNWTIGYTPELVVGVWVGNNDNTEMRGVSGISGAAPIWHDFMTSALNDSPVTQFRRPAGVVTREVCAETGMPVDGTCRERRSEIFAAAQLPRNLVPIAIDPTPDEADSMVAIVAPASGQAVSGIVDVMGRATAANFAFFSLEYGAGDYPGYMQPLLTSPAMVLDGVLGRWDTRALPPGPYTLRLQVADRNGVTREARVAVFVQGEAAPGAEWPENVPTPFATSPYLPYPTSEWPEGYPIQPPSYYETAVPYETTESYQPPLVWETPMPFDTPIPYEVEPPSWETSVPPETGIPYLDGPPTTTARGRLRP